MHEQIFYSSSKNYQSVSVMKRSSHGVMVNGLNCSLDVGKFKLQSHNHIRFWTNTLGKSTNPLIPPAVGLIVLPMVSETKVQSQVKSYQRLKKIILDNSLLNTQHYKVWIKGKWRNPGKGGELFPTPWYSSY